VVYYKNTNRTYAIVDGSADWLGKIPTKFNKINIPKKCSSVPDPRSNGFTLWNRIRDDYFSGSRIRHIFWWDNYTFSSESFPLISNKTSKLAPGNRK
jgi:hypothetical protein